MVQGGRRQQAQRTVAAYLIGAALGGAGVMAFVLFARVPLSWPGSYPVRGLLAAACFVGAGLADLGIVRLAPNQKQVRQSHVRRFGPVRAYFTYGLQLGTNTFTYSPVYLPFAALVGAALLLDPLAALAWGAIAGATRVLVGLPLGRTDRWLGWFIRVRTGATDRLRHVSAVTCLAMAALLLSIVVGT